MSRVWTNLGLVGALLVLCYLAIYPPQENLRLGKDLAGGVSLVYTINVDEEEPNPSQAIDNMIQVYQDRVNPSGTREITFVVQGQDRIEISMPLPSEAVKQLKSAYLSELQKFESYELDISAFERAMRLQGQERQAALERLMGDSAAKRALLEPVVEAADAADAARERYQVEADALETAREAARDAITGGDDPAFADATSELVAQQQDVVKQALDAAGEAEVRLEETREAVLEKRVTVRELQRAIEQPSKPIIKPRNRDDNEAVELPGERDLALESIRERVGDLPGAIELLGNGLDEDEEGYVQGSLFEAYGAYQAQAEGLDDPNELKRLLRGAGVLSFRIAVTEELNPVEVEQLREELRTNGPQNVTTPGFLWRPINQLDDWFEYADQLETLRADPQSWFRNRGALVVEPYGGTYWVLLHDTEEKRLTQSDGSWGLAGVTPTTDPRSGTPALTFRMNARGALLMRELTRPHVGQPMAIMLDERVYSAPNINEELGSNIQVSGDFTPSEINYLVSTLQAGSLTATLSEQPISENTIAPDLGQDNLERGLEASYVSLAAVGVFMVVYYFSMGFVALLALAVNAVLILGIMALAESSFTLPGIAGIVLTFGMAVDANVLIYERIREEIIAGLDLRSAVRVAFKKVTSTIVDANVTNLIVCFVLFYTATQEIKGFAVTLGVGVVTTMFTSLVVSRLIFAALVERIRIKRMRQLPLAIPAIDKILTPKLNWIGLRPLFGLISAVLLGIGVFMVYSQRGEMLDTEFRGGTVVDIRLQQPDGGELTLTRSEIEDRVHAIGETALAGEGGLPEELGELRNADIQAINPQADGITSDHFKIKTVISDDESIDSAATLSDRVIDAISAEFESEIAAQPALRFTGSDAASWDADGAPVVEIAEPTLGRNDHPALAGYRNDVSEYLGGVAIVLDDLQPLRSEQELRQRLEFLRGQEPFASNALRRQFDLIVLEGTRDEVEKAVVVVLDPAVSPLFSPEQWENEFAAQEWLIAREGLTSRTTLAGVQTFSPSIAQTFRAQAIVAVLLSFLMILAYIWIRFGSVRYSLAAILALVHDVVAVVGLIALAEIIYEVTGGQSAAIGILPFRIDLGLIAALLTIVGYSLNDTIVILDRIRENRGKLAYASKDVVNRSISQTISRTLITSGTTLIAVLILFILGGEGLASFTYALSCGVIVGTYSSIAIAAPLVFKKDQPPASTFRGTPDATPAPAMSPDPRT